MGKNKDTTDDTVKTTDYFVTGENLQIIETLSMAWNNVSNASVRNLIKKKIEELLKKI